MSQRVDSKTLFVKQVQSHSQSLCDLLSCDTTSAVPANMIERCAVSTRMLAGTSSLIGLSVWDQILTSYEDLLARYNETGLLWDDKIAQVTSEIIEKEETLVASHENDPTVAVEDLCDLGEVAALGQEIAVLQESISMTPPPAEDIALTGQGVEQSQQAQAESAQPSSDVFDTLSAMIDTVPMKGVVSEMKNVYQALIEGLESGAFGSRDWASDEIADISNQLYFLNFYICSVEQMIDRQSPSTPVNQCSLVPLRTVLNDFASEISNSGERCLDMVLNGESVEIDPRLLPVAGGILQRLATDVFNRSEGPALVITIKVGNYEGALRWQLTDNGDNFISDSQLDHEDQLAFYPGLKNVRKLLGRYHGVLWVEPNGDRDARFEFTIPVSKAEDSFMLWGEGPRTFGVRSVQLCDIVSVNSAPRGEDSYGEFLTIDNKRVPLLKLDVFFKEAPSGGEMIAVIGSLEKRVAFYVPGSGKRVEGKTLEGVVPVWQGPAQLVAQVDDRRVTLLDADKILEEYLDVTGDLDAGGVSGGVVEDESELSSSQASNDSDVKTPPDQSWQADDGDSVEVLVVEQSESLRGVFTDIFGQHRIKAAFAGAVDEAIELVHSRAPRVIVSEFRMPTMAAKVLVEALESEGKSIPVLVTTSQSGKTADLLVEKLGVAGYLSKPLNQKEVASRVNGFLTEHAQA